MDLERGLVDQARQSQYDWPSADTPSHGPYFGLNSEKQTQDDPAVNSNISFLRRTPVNGDPASDSAVQADASSDSRGTKRSHSETFNNPDCFRSIRAFLSSAEETQSLDQQSTIENVDLQTHAASHISDGTSRHTPDSASESQDVPGNKKNTARRRTPRKSGEGPGKIGRPRKEEHLLKRPRYVPRQKATKLRVDKPVKVALNDDCWRNIFRFMDPNTLLQFRFVSTPFYQVLTDEDTIWEDARNLLYGNDCPPPPIGLPAYSPFRSITAPNGNSSTRSTPSAESVDVADDSEDEDEQRENISFDSWPLDTTTRDVRTESGEERVDRSGKKVIKKPRKIYPKGTHRQYLDLLAGTGCMICGSSKTKRAIWAFMRRWCDSCFKKNTMGFEEARIILQTRRDLLFCIPRAQCDKWGSHRSVAEPTGHFSLDQRQLRHSAFLRRDVSGILTEYDEFKKTLVQMSSEERSVAEQRWQSSRIKAMDKQMLQARRTAIFQDRQLQIAEGVDDDLQDAFCQKRKAFFERKASELKPPLDPRALRMIPAFQKSLKEKRDPTERAWRALLEKVDAARGHAEAQLAYQQNLREIPEQTRKLASRQDYRHLGHAVVTKLAEAIIDSLEEAKIADEDFALFVLRKTWEQYYDIPEEERPLAQENDILKNRAGDAKDESETGFPHVLSLMDALRVFETKIRAHVKQWGPIRAKAAQTFKCPGCTRTDYNKAWSFKSLFVHLMSKHGSELGSDWAIYGRISNDYDCRSNFPFLALPWPRNFPLLARHHKATGQWDPDADLPYQFLRRNDVDDRRSLSAFRGRSLSGLEKMESLDMEQLAKRAIYAATLLANTKLDQQYQAQIAWEYMIRITKQKCYAILENGESSDPPDPFGIFYSFEKLQELVLAFIRLGEFDLFSKVSCKLCNDSMDTVNLRNIKWAVGGRSLGELAEHWIQHMPYPGYRIGIENSGPDSVWDELIQFPKDSELVEALRQDGMESARVAFDTLFPPDHDPNSADGENLQVAVKWNRSSPARGDDAIDPVLSENSPSTHQSKTTMSHAHNLQSADTSPSASNSTSSGRHQSDRFPLERSAVSELTSLDLLAAAAARDGSAGSATPQ